MMYCDDTWISLQGQIIQELCFIKPGVSHPQIQFPSSVPLLAARAAPELKMSDARGTNRREGPATIRVIADAHIAKDQATL